MQAFGRLELDFAASGLAAMTVSGHKTGGPYGTGTLLVLLDAQGIACSTGPACAAGVPEPSHVVLAAGAEPVDLVRTVARH